MIWEPGGAALAEGGSLHLRKCLCHGDSGLEGGGRMSYLTLPSLLLEGLGVDSF